ncbi:MAG TPA: hypothetical protein VHO67_22385 [Polyangia bacterium]|nr:hypothetical protein [Polyangia bacterium]
MIGRPGKSVVAATIAAALCATAGRATAADASDLIKEGIALRRQGDDAGGLEKFQQAYEAQQTPRTLAQIALAEQALGRWAAAHDHLAAALDARSDPWISRNQAALTRALNDIQPHVGRLEVLGGPAGAEVRLNGVSAGSLPLPRALTVATGSVLIEIAAPGFHAAQRSTIVRAGQITRESFDPLTPVAQTTADAIPPTPHVASEPSSGAPAAAGVNGGTVEGQSGAARPLQDANEPSRLRLGAKWIAGGIGVAALVGGTISYVLHRSSASEFGRDCALDAHDVPVSTNPTVRQSTCDDRRDRYETEYRWSIIGFATGAVFAAAGVVLWLTEPNNSEADATRTALTCVPLSSATLSTVGLGCRFQF